MSTETLEHDDQKPKVDQPAPTSKPSAHAWLTLVAVTFGIMIVQIDGTVVAIANPAIAASLNARLEDLQWVTNGYLLALAGLMIPAGTLADKLGRKKIFLIGVVGFTIASLLAGLSNSVEMLIAVRVGQGVSGALLMPATLAVIRAAFPPDKLSMAIGIWGGVSALALAGGPILGGILVENVTWNWVFFINVPVGAIAVIIGLLIIKESKEPGAGGLDLPGALVLTGAMASLVWAITRAPSQGWLSTTTLGFIALSVVLFAVFIVVERKVSSPTVPLELFKNRSLAIGTLLTIVVMFALFGVLFFITFYLQGVQGKGAIAAGVALLPLTLVFTVSSPLGGWVTGKLGARGGLVIGSLLIIGAYGLLLLLDSNSSAAALWGPFILIGFGMGFVFIASTQAIVGNAPVDKAGTAGGLQQSMAQLGGVFGTAVLGSVMAAVVSSKFGSRLGEALGVLPGLPPGAGDQLATSMADQEALRQAVELGFPPAASQAVAEQLGKSAAGGQLPQDAVQPMTEAISKAAHQTFVDGLHTVFLVGGAVAIVGGVLALFVRNTKPSADTPTPSVHV